MANPLPHLTWFRAFESAARHLSFTIAAEELGLTQSAISQHVRALEDRLGSQLFLRANRSLKLTDAGRLLQPDVATAMGLLSQATQRFQPTITKPKLTIATSASIAHSILAPKLAEFYARHPDIAIHLITTVWPDDISATSADIEIRFGAPSIVGQNAELLEPSFLHAVAAPPVAANLPNPATWADLAGFPLIQPIGLSTTWTSIAESAKIAPLEAQYFVDTHAMAVDLAVGAAGIALSHCQITQNSIARGDIHDLGFPKLPATEGYYLALKPTPLVEHQQLFLTWFRAQLIAPFD